MGAGTTHPFWWGGTTHPFADAFNHRTKTLKPNDSLGDRMKGQYEVRTQTSLPRRTYTIVRVDGKAFHTYAKDADRPFDHALMRCMDTAALALAKEVQGFQLAYIQSDEISVLLTDFESDQTQAWFDGNVQKLVSISASCVTARFNQAASNIHEINGREDWSSRLAMFDARCFTIPDPVEVENYFIWRQQDAERNSLQMLARAHHSHKTLEGVSSTGIHDLLYMVGVNWNECQTREKRGRCIVRCPDGRLATHHEIPVFTSEDGRPWLKSYIPRYS